MKKRPLFLALTLFLCFFRLSAQNDEGSYHDQFTAVILHVDQLQQFMQPEISPQLITDALDGMGYHHYEIDGDHFWLLNPEQRVVGGRTYPMLMLIYQVENYVLGYASTDSTIVDYLLNRDLSQNGYRQTSPDVWRNSTYEVEKGFLQFDFNGDDIPDDFWYLSIIDFKAREERKRKYESLLVSFGQCMDSLEREVFLVNDTARVYAQRVSAGITSLNKIIQLGDDYHDQHNYGKARQQYQEAVRRQSELASSDMREAYAYIRRHYDNLSNAATSIAERHKPLRGSDLPKDYSLMQNTLDTLDYYFKVFNADNYTSDLNEKIKANDCDDIYRNFGQIYKDRDEVVRLYDQKGYDRLLKDAQAEMRNYAENRSKYYNQNADLLDFLHISKKSFEEMYDNLGRSILEHRLNNSRDSILLCAIRQSPSLEKANLSKSRKLKIDKQYRTVLKKSEVNLDDYRNSDTYARIIDIVLSGNEKARKEFQTNGHYFSTRTAFYNSYVSSNYASQLQYYKRQEKARKEAEARAREQARRQAELQEKARQEQLRRQRAASRRSAHYTAYPPIEKFAFGMNAGYGFSFIDDFGFDLHCGLSTMFPTQRRMSWGFGATAGMRGSSLDLYVTAGPQFYHGQSNRWQFLWGLYGGMDFGGGPMGTVRIGTRYRIIFFYADIDVAPASDSQASLKMGLGLSFGY